MQKKEQTLFRSWWYFCGGQWPWAFSGKNKTFEAATNSSKQRLQARGCARSQGCHHSRCDQPNSDIFSKQKWIIHDVTNQNSDIFSKQKRTRFQKKKSIKQGRVLLGNTYLLWCKCKYVVADRPLTRPTHHHQHHHHQPRNAQRVNIIFLTNQRVKSRKTKQQQRWRRLWRPSPFLH